MIPACLIAALVSAAPYRAANVEVPDAIEQVRLPETMKALGVPVRIRAVRSKQRVAPLIENFRQQFEKARLFVPGTGELHSAGDLVQVTALDVEHQNSISVLLQPNLDGTTTVVVGEAFLHAISTDAPATFAPVFPGATGLISADLEIGKSLSYAAKATPAELEGFYRETLGGAGFKQTAPGQFERQGELLRVWFKPRDGDETGVVVIRGRGH